MKRISSLLATLIVTAALVCPAMAQKGGKSNSALKIPTGKVFTTKGKVEWLKSGTSKWARIKAPFVIEQSDKIRTGWWGKAEIYIRYGSKVRLSGRTTFTLEKVSREENIVNVLVGRVEMWIKKFYNRRFTVRTPTSVAAVRGTTFAVEVDKNGNAVWDIFSGSLNVSDFHNNVVNLVKNQRLVVTKAKGAVAPKALPKNVKPPVEPETIAEEKMEIKAETQKTESEIDAKIEADAKTEPEEAAAEAAPAEEAAVEEAPAEKEVFDDTPTEDDTDTTDVATESDVNPTDEVLESEEVVSPSSP